MIKEYDKSRRTFLQLCLGIIAFISGLSIFLKRGQRINIRDKSSFRNLKKARFYKELGGF